jgi:hypothetical protein
MQFFGIVPPNLPVRLFLLRKTKDQKPGYMFIRTLSYEAYRRVFRILKAATSPAVTLMKSGCLFKLGAGISNLFFMALRKAMLTMKRFPKGSAIKNSADEDPEGYSTILVAPMCNGGLVSPLRANLERPNVNKAAKMLAEFLQTLGWRGQNLLSMKRRKGCGRRLDFIENLAALV